MPEEVGSKRQAFAWHDDYITGSESKAVVHPLALVARVTLLCEDMSQQALEASNEPAWIGWGIGSACRALVETGDLAGLGVLLTGLETLVPPEIRARWPLHERCSPLRDHPHQA